MNLFGRVLAASLPLFLAPLLPAQAADEVRDPVRDALRALQRREGQSPGATAPSAVSTPGAPAAPSVPTAPSVPSVPQVPAPIEDLVPSTPSGMDDLPLPQRNAGGSLDAAEAGLGLLTQMASKISINSDDTTYDTVAGVARAEGNVDILYEDTRITADRAEYDYNSGEVRAYGDVAVYKDGDVRRGETMVYNVKTGQISSSSLKSGLGPILFETDDFEGSTQSDGVLQTTDTYFTTHDSASPNYHIKAKSVDIYPGERIVFRGAKFYVGKTPVFYLPYFVQPFDDELGYFFRPGYNSYWGGFLLNRYGFLVGDHTLAKADFDLRSGRGAAVGLELESLRFKNNPNFGRIKFYYAHDIDPEYETSSFTRQDLEAERYRVNFQHRIYVGGPEESTLYADFDLNYLSDQHFYEDFFFNEFRVDPRPDNLINLVKHDARGTLSVTGRFQFNDFLRRDERLPEIALDFTTQPVFGTGIFYRGTTSYGVLRDRLTESDRNQLFDAANVPENFAVDEEGQVIIADNGNPLLATFPNTTDSEFNRLHTWHEFLYPMKLGQVLNITPRVGAGFTSYDSIADGGSAFEDQIDREAFGFGVEASMKWSKTWDDMQSQRWGIDGFRHILQPYVNYSYLDADSPGEQGLRGIDVWRPTTRLRPIDVPLMTGIDDIRSWNIVRTGVRNELQTRRDGKTHGWMGLNTYLDYYVDDPESDRDVSNLYNDFYWSPLPWLRLQIDSQIPIGDDSLNYTEVNSRLNWMPNRNLSVGFSHLYLSEHPIFEDSSRYALNTYLRLGDSWGLSTVHSFEAEDSTLEYQSYRIHRDLTSWTASLGAVVLAGRGTQEDAFGLVLTFTLKDFPDVTIPLDFNPSPTGR